MANYNYANNTTTHCILTNNTRPNEPKSTEQLKRKHPFLISYPRRPQVAPLYLLSRPPIYLIGARARSISRFARKIYIQQSPGASTSFK